MHRNTASAENRLVVPVLLPSGRNAPLVGNILTRQGDEVAIFRAMQTMMDHIAYLYGPFVIGEEACQENPWIGWPGRSSASRSGPICRGSC
jgi:hypothetical protein